jgi:hypothetical protein
MLMHVILLGTITYQVPVLGQPPATTCLMLADEASLKNAAQQTEEEQEHILQW